MKLKKDKDFNLKIESSKISKYDNEYKELVEKKFQETFSSMNANLGLLKEEINNKFREINLTNQEEKVKNEKLIENKFDEIKSVKKSIKSFNEKIEKDKIESQQQIKVLMNSLANDISSDIQKLQQELEDFDKKIIDMNNIKEEAIKEFEEQFYKKLATKMDSSTLPLKLKELREEFQNNVKSIEKNCENFFLKNKDDNDHISEIEKISKELNNCISNINNLNSDLKECVDLNTSLDEKFKKLFSSLTEKLSNYEINSNNELKEVKNELKEKSRIKDVIALIDMKPNIDIVNKRFGDIESKLEAKISTTEFSNSLNEQALINEALCNENCVGRWIWKTSKLINSLIVPWEMQSINTCPDNFIWEKDKPFIISVVAGLYEITLGFYSKKKPTVQVLINGESVLSAINTASYVVHHSSGQIKNTGRHTLGNITGLTLIDFISLPEKAKIAVSYNGDTDGEGFLGLKKNYKSN